MKTHLPLRHEIYHVFRVVFTFSLICDEATIFMLGNATIIMWPTYLLAKHIFQDDAHFWLIKHVWECHEKNEKKNFEYNMTILRQSNLCIYIYMHAWVCFNTMIIVVRGGEK